MPIVEFLDPPQFEGPCFRKPSGAQIVITTCYMFMPFILFFYMTNLQECGEVTALRGQTSMVPLGQQCISYDLFISSNSKRG